MQTPITKYLEDDFANGAETVEIVFGIVLAVGLGAAMLAFQGTIVNAFKNAQENVASVFKKLTTASGASTASNFNGNNV